MSKPKLLEEEFLGGGSELEMNQKLGPLLIRAVRQLGRERKAYQSLFEAAGDLSQNDRLVWPELAKAYDEVVETPEPDPDVLALLEEAQ